MAKTDLETLVISLEANVKSYEKAIKKAQADTAANMTIIENRVQQAGSKIERSFANAGKSFGALTRDLAGSVGVTIGLAQLTRSLSSAVQSYQEMQNALKVAGIEGKALDAVFRTLYASAQEHGAPIEALVKLYGHAAMAQEELGASAKDIAGFADGVAVALRVAGTSAGEASGALLQLGQLLGSGRVHAEEFNSILEGARPILQAVALGIEEAGGSVSKLNALVVDGKISNQAFFRGFEAGLPAIREMAARMDDTPVQAWNRLQNAVVGFAGEMNNTTDASRLITSALDDLTATVEGMPNVLDGAARGFRDLRQRVEDFYKLLEIDKVGPWAEEIHKALGTPDMWSSIHDATGGRSRDFLEFFGLYTNRTDALNQRDPYGPQLPKGWRPPVKIDDISPTLLRPVSTIKASDYAGPLGKSGSGAKDSRKYLGEHLIKGRDSEHVERLSSQFAGKLAKMLSEMPEELSKKVNITSGYRSPERQQQLWVEAVRRYGSEEEARKWVAPPGRSQHNKGNAADLSYGGSAEARQWMHSNAKNFGLTFPLSNENWHIEDLDARRSQVDKDREDNMQREIQAIEKQTEAREQQREALDQLYAGANDHVARQQLEMQTMGMSAQQAAALRYEFELLAEAKRAGIEITPRLQERFKQLGQDMAAADVSADALRKRIDELNDTAAYFGNEAVDALSGLITGTTTAEQAVQSLIQSLVRATLQAALLGEGPLASLFGGNGGLLKGLGGLFSGGGASAGASFTGAGIYHAGGVVGAGGASRSVPASLFAGAPRYHSGGVAGLKPDEIPAILQRGEYVVSKANMAAAAVAGRGRGGAAPMINVINNGPPTPEVQASRSGDGWSVDVMIPSLENAMAARAGRGHGSLGKAVTSTATGRNLRG